MTTVSDVGDIRIEFGRLAELAATAVAAPDVARVEELLTAGLRGLEMLAFVPSIGDGQVLGYLPAGFVPSTNPMLDRTRDVRGRAGRAGGRPDPTWCQSAVAARAVTPGPSTSACLLPTATLISSRG